MGERNGAQSALDSRDAVARGLIVYECCDNRRSSRQPGRTSIAAPAQENTEVGAIALCGANRIRSLASSQEIDDLVAGLVHLIDSTLARCVVNYDIMRLTSMISAAQIRAARGILGIPAAELAAMSGVDLRTIQRFESVDGIPKSRSGTLERIKDTLEAAGIVFLGDPTLSPGVQLKIPISKRPHKSV